MWVCVCVCCLPIIIMVLRFSHVLAESIICVFLLQNTYYSTVWMHQNLFIRQKRPLDSSSFLVITNKAAMSIRVEVFVWTGFHFV